MTSSLKNTIQSSFPLGILAWTLAFSALCLRAPLWFCLSAPLGMIISISLRGYRLQIWLLIGFVLCLFFALRDPWPPWAPQQNSWQGQVQNAIPGPQKQHFDFKSDQHLYRVSLQGMCLPSPGTRIQILAALQARSQMRNPGEFDYDYWLRTHGYSGSFSLQCSQIQILAKPSPYSISQFFFQADQWLSHRIEQSQNASSAALLQAMLIGNDDSMDPELGNAFKKTGLSHLIAISGMHIALLAMIVQILIGCFTSKRRWHYGITLIVLCLYAPMTGNPPSVQRAVLFYAIYSLGKACGRKSSALNALFLTASLLLIYNPLNILDIGFQLSFVATFAILYPPSDYSYFKKWSGPKAQLWTWILQPLTISLWLGMATAPLLAWHFQTFPIISIIGNLFAIPLSTAFLINGSLGLIAPHSWSTPWAILAQEIYGLLDWSIRVLAQIPGTQIHLRLDNPIFIAALFSIFISIPHWNLKYLRWISYFAIFNLSIPPLYQSIWACFEPQVKLWALDIGQGDAFVIRSPSGQTVMIDNGPQNFRSHQDQSQKVILPFFRNQGIDQIDLLILSHGDLDHIGSTMSLLEQIDIKAIYINPQDLSHPNSELQKILNYCQQHQIPIQGLERGQNFNFADGLQIRILHPDRQYYAESNWASLVLQLKYANHSALFTGDLEEEGEIHLLQSQQNLQSEILKIGHHGSKNGSSEQLLQQVQPLLALISAGKNNRFHHPHPLILDRLNRFHIPTFCTIDHGNLYFELTTRGWTFVPFIP